MKVTALTGNFPGGGAGMEAVMKVIADTLAELGVEWEEVNLALEQIPFCDGLPTQKMDGLSARLQESAGLVLASASDLAAPSAILQNTLEYLSLPGYQKALKGKNCLLVCLCQRQGADTALAYLSRVIQGIGGYDAVRVAMTGGQARSLERQEDRDILEKQVEDFYRMLRQNRRFFLPAEAEAPPVRPSAPAEPPLEDDLLQDKLDYAEVSEKLEKKSYSRQQMEDMQELSRFFAQKLEEPEREGAAFAGPIVRPAEPPAPRSKTVRQMTQSLPRHFQPQLAQGLEAVIQLVIAGGKGFESYLTIRNAECEYHAGKSSSPDVTILADAEVWEDVLRSKYTAQKAFMIGKLKVRGNFVLLTKFDQMFKFE